MSQRSFSRAHQRRIAAQARRESLLRRRRTGLATGAAIAATALFAPAVHAENAPFVVNSNADATADTCDDVGTGNGCTLRDAIAAANANPGADTITFASALTGDTITLGQGPLYTGDSSLATSDLLTITGPSSGTITVSGDGESQIIRAQGTSPLDISNLTLTDGASGDASGGAIGAGGKYQNGGFTGPALTLTHVTITSSNSSSRNGGAINDYAPITLVDCTITGNHANYGGAIGNVGDVTITNSTISGNTASGKGGALSVGAKYERGLGNVHPTTTISGSTLNDNTATSDGGAFYSENTVLKVDSSTFSGNSGDSGGAVSMGQGAVTVAGSTISGNTATVQGAGVSSADNGKYPAGQKHGSVTVTDSTIRGNTVTVPADTEAAPGKGGGIFADDAALTVRGTTLSGNTADHGGAVYEIMRSQTSARGVSSQPPPQSSLVENSTISGNTADRGGGLYLYGAYDMTLRGATIDGNHAHTQGGGLFLASSSNPVLQDTILADNAFDASGTNQGPDAFTDESSTLAGQYSLIKDVSGFSFAPSGEDAITHGLEGKSPQLGPLQDNGGPTKTMKPSMTSPVIDAGSAFGMIVDQRGVARPQLAAPDIGAVELRPPSATTGSATGLTTTSATLGGTINVRGAGSYHFDYGTNTSYGASTPPTAAPSDSADHAETAGVTGLQPNTTYHFRIVATNSDGTANGADQTFTTGATVGHPPIIDNLTVKPRCVTTTALAKPGATGMSFSYDLSEDATVTYRILRRVDSPKWRHCPEPGGTKPVIFKTVLTTTDPHATKGRAAATRALKSRAVGLTKGKHTVTLVHILAGHKLGYGSYILKITGANAFGKTVRPAVIQFWILGHWPKHKHKHKH